MTALGPIASSAVADIWHGITPGGFFGSFSTPTRKKLSVAIIATTVAVGVPYAPQPANAGWQSQFDLPSAKPRQSPDWQQVIVPPFEQPFGWYGPFDLPQKKNNLVEDQSGWYQEEAPLVVIDYFGWYSQFPVPKFKPSAVALTPWAVNINLHIPRVDVFVETNAERKRRVKLEKRVLKEQQEAWEAEKKWREDRRLAIAEAVIGPMVPIEWTGIPAKVASTPQTQGLTEAIFAAKTKIRTVNEIAEMEAEEAQLEKLLLDL